MRAPGIAPSAVRAAALGGVIGPTAFVAAWTAGARFTNGRYSSVDDAISRLAALGADTRPLMTAGFVCFAIGVPLYASALRAVLPGPAFVAAAATGIATLAVAALPLGHSATGDAWHGVSAGVGYVTIVALPLLAAGPLRERGHRLLAVGGIAAGVVSALSLVLTFSSLPHGLLQRLGLTVVDVWIGGSAVAIALGRLRPTRRGAREPAGRAAATEAGAHEAEHRVQR
jgi:hypothetical protein